MKDDAYDYLTKPIDPQRLRVLLEKLVERHDSEREVPELKRELVTDGRLGHIVGKRAAIRKVYRHGRPGGAYPSVGAHLRRIGNREGVGGGSDP